MESMWDYMFGQFIRKKEVGMSSWGDPSDVYRQIRANKKELRALYNELKRKIESGSMFLTSTMDKLDVKIEEQNNLIDML